MVIKIHEVKSIEILDQSNCKRLLFCCRKELDMELKFEDIYELEKLRNGYIKDEYHTISKLYFNRMILFMYLCKAYKNKAWKSKFHDDNSMFVVGITTP